MASLASKFAQSTYLNRVRQQVQPRTLRLAAKLPPGADSSLSASMHAKLMAPRTRLPVNSCNFTFCQGGGRRSTPFAGIQPARGGPGLPGDHRLASPDAPAAFCAVPWCCKKRGARGTERTAARAPGGLGWLRVLFGALVSLFGGFLGKKCCTTGAFRLS